MLPAWWGPPTSCCPTVDRSPRGVHWAADAVWVFDGRATGGSGCSAAVRADVQGPWGPLVGSGYGPWAGVFVRAGGRSRSSSGAHRWRVTLWRSCGRPAREPARVGRTCSRSLAVWRLPLACRALGRDGTTAWPDGAQAFAVLSVLARAQWVHPDRLSVLTGLPRDRSALGCRPARHVVSPYRRLVGACSCATRRSPRPASPARRVDAELTRRAAGAQPWTESTAPTSADVIVDSSSSEVT